MLERIQDLERIARVENAFANLLNLLRLDMTKERCRAGDVVYFLRHQAHDSGARGIYCYGVIA